MFLKTHHIPGMDDVVAVCDRELINTTISYNRITVTITESFYGNREANEEEVRSVLTKAGNINLIGKRAVNIAIDMGLVSQAGCIMIGDIPHAQIYRI